MTHYSPFPWSPEAVALLTERQAAGASSRQIAQALTDRFHVPITRSAVCGKLNRMGIARLHKPVASPPAKLRRAKPELAFASGFRRPKLKLVVAGNGTVVICPPAAAPVAPPPREVSVEVAASPRPWIERRFGECAFPVDGVGDGIRSCCNVTAGKTYCPDHEAVMRGSMPKSWAGFSKPRFAKAMG